MHQQKLNMHGHHSSVHKDRDRDHHHHHHRDRDSHSHHRSSLSGNTVISPSSVGTNDTSSLHRFSVESLTGIRSSSSPNSEGHGPINGSRGDGVSGCKREPLDLTSDEDGSLGSLGDGDSDDDLADIDIDDDGKLNSNHHFLSLSFLFHPIN